jgi:3-dehydroquinate dehydratase-2
LVEALRAFAGPKIEVHITNVHARDSIYHNSQVTKVVTAVIAGLGFDGYEYALESVRRHLDRGHAKP